MNDNKDSKAVTKGWTIKNFLIGGALLVFGCLLYASDVYAAYFYVGDSARSLPLLIVLLQYVAIIMVLIGVSGFWIIIPAFQRWWHARRWLAWIFFIIGLVGPYLLLSLILWGLFSMKS